MQFSWTNLSNLLFYNTDIPQRVYIKTKQDMYTKRCKHLGNTEHLFISYSYMHGSTSEMKCVRSICQLILHMRSLTFKTLLISQAWQSNPVTPDNKEEASKRIQNPRTLWDREAVCEAWSSYR